MSDILEFKRKLLIFADQAARHQAPSASYSGAELQRMFIKVELERDELKEQLAESRELTRWIPCSERLPEESGDYFIWLEERDTADKSRRVGGFAAVEYFDINRGDKGEWTAIWGFEISKWKRIY